MYSLYSQTIQLSYTQRKQNLDPEIFSTMAYFLEIHGLHLLYGPFRTILTELVNNAFKANLKRLFFKKHNLDLVKDYQIGQKQFTKLLHTDSKELFSLGMESTLSVDIIFKSTKKNLIIQVKNEATILENELKVINRLLKSPLEKKQKQIKEKEGGGLGLKMIFLMLTNLGLNKSWQFKNNKKSTEFSITIPTAIDISKISQSDCINISKSMPKLIPVKSLSLLDYEDTLAAQLNQLVLNNNNSALHDLEITETAIPNTLVYNQFANSLIKDSQKVNLQIFKSIFKNTDLQKNKNFLKQLNFVLLSDRLSFALQTITINKICKISKRSKPIKNSYFIAATLGISPATLIKIWVMKKNNPELIKYILNEFSTEQDFFVIRILYLYWSTRHSNSKKEFNWDLYSQFIKNDKKNCKNAINLLNLIKKKRKKNDRIHN